MCHSQVVCYGLSAMASTVVVNVTVLVVQVTPRVAPVMVCGGMRRAGLLAGMKSGWSRSEQRLPRNED